MIKIRALKKMAPTSEVRLSPHFVPKPGRSGGAEAKLAERATRLLVSETGGGGVAKRRRTMRKPSTRTSFHADVLTQRRGLSPQARICL